MSDAFFVFCNCEVKPSSVAFPSCVCCERADRGTTRAVSCSWLMLSCSVQFASLSVHQHCLHWILPIGCVKVRLREREREKEREEDKERQKEKERQRERHDKRMRET